MKKITNEELKTILRNHEKWLKMTKEANEYITSDLRANLSYMDLSGVNLSKLDLRSADFHGSILKGANLSESNFSSANFNEADLSEADLSNSILKYAYFNHSNLRGASLNFSDLKFAEFMDADLRFTSLREVNLSFSNMHEALLVDSDLSFTNLAGADLSKSDLRGVNLDKSDISDVNLLGADLREAKNVPYIPMICPEEGSFIGWKKCEYYNDQLNRCITFIVKLEIPAEAKRSSATSRKCRCNKAKVLDIMYPDGSKSKRSKCSSTCDPNFIYEVGKTVEVINFDEDRWAEYAPGIHFFMNREEAVRYIY